MNNKLVGAIALIGLIFICVGLARLAIFAIPTAVIAFCITFSGIVILVVAGLLTTSKPKEKEGK